MINLPRDILEYITSFIKTRTLLELSRTCRYFYSLTHNEHVWKKKCLDNFNLSQDIAYRQTGWKNLYISLRSPDVYTWGENFDNRLGLISSSRKRSQREVAKPCEVLALKGKGIVDIVSGGGSFHALDRMGYVWFWGSMSGNQQVPTRLQDNVQDKIKFASISSGQNHCIGLAQDGTVWQWSDWKVIRKVDLICSKVVQVTANWSYSSVLTDQGALWIVPVEQTIAYFGVILQDPIVQLAGLDNHTLALTQQGRVLKMATKNYAAFAASPMDFIIDLVHFGAPSQANERHKRFITGAYESFAVHTEKGKVLLGNIHSRADSLPTCHSGLEDEQICKISFGDYHYGALTSKGELMTWGRYSSGALGQGANGRNSETPEYVNSLKNKYVVAIGFGGWQSSALVIDRK